MTRGADPRDRLMDEAEIPHAIELLVGLLGLAVVRGDRRAAAAPARTRSPWSSPGSLVGIAAERRRVPSRSTSRPTLVLLVLLPGPRVRGRLPAALRRAPSLVRRPGPAGDPGRRDLGGRRRGRPEPRDRASPRPRVHRRGDGVGDRPGRGRRDVQASARPARRCRRWSTARASSTTGPASSCSRSPLQVVVAPVGPGEAVVAFAGTVAHQRRHRPRRPGSSPLGSSRLVDDHLIELTISVVLAYGSYMLADQLPPVRGHRHGHRRDRARERRTGPGAVRRPARTPSTRSGSSSPTC